MTKYIVHGGKPLFGEVEISGAKNAAVAIIPAAILVDGGVAKQYAEANPDLVIADASAELGEPAPYCVAVQKGDPKGLLPAINAAIAKMNEANMLETFIADADSLADVAVEVSAN